MFIECSGKQAVRYLFELTCGMQSQIFGEDQILSQVKNALQNARDNEQIDSVLETLFCLAITSAKRVKTDVTLTSKNTSVPDSVIYLLKSKFKTIKNKKCLVIGNGEIGRLMATLLVECGCKVTMTLRQYKKQDVIIPNGCEVIRYDYRYDIIKDMDFIFSATLSPHYTLKIEDFNQSIIDKKYYIFDLAIPRDMEPKIRELNKVTVYDIDSLGMDVQCDKEELRKAKVILNKYEKEYLDWYYDRKFIPIIHKIGVKTGEVTNAKLTKEYKKMDITLEEQQKLRKNIQVASQKSIEKLIFAAKAYMDPAQWNSCITAFDQAMEEME